LFRREVVIVDVSLYDDLLHRKLRGQLTSILHVPQAIKLKGLR